MPDGQMDVFFSHSSEDKLAVEEIAERLKRVGIHAWLDKWNLIPGKAWQPDIEKALQQCRACAVFIGPGGLGPWQHEEVRMAINKRVNSHGDYSVIPVLLPGVDRPQRSELPGFLTATMWVEFRRTLDEVEPFRRLVCGIRSEEPQPSIGESIDGSVRPYRGLKQFREEHARFFFGREALTEWLVDDLRPRISGNAENRLLAIIGSSGSGKSSLARAGLIPALRGGALDGSERWPILICRPGQDPLESLTMALAKHEKLSAEIPDELALMKQFHESERTLHLKTRRALHEQEDSQRVVIYVDQFEEIFTICKDEAARKSAIDNLLYAATIPHGRTIVVLTMRADFYSRCAGYPKLAAAFRNHQELVGPMMPKELRRVIERPAQMVGCELEPGLLELLIQHAGTDSGRLPLLQHVLDRLWQKRSGRRLTIQAYNEMGQLAGALESYADEVYDELPPSEQEICRQVFMRLTQPGEGTEDTKRRTPLKELQSESHDVVLGLVDRLATARLLTKESDQKDQTAGYVEVAHEALIRSWGKFRRWIDADRENLLIHRRLTVAAQEWEKATFDPSYLYDGARLSQVESWLTSYNAIISDLESSFLAASRDRSKRAANRSKRAIYAIIGIACLATIFAIGSFVSYLWALDKRDEAEIAWAKGILRSLEDKPWDAGDDQIPELNKVELATLWEIAASDNERVRTLCIEQSLGDPDLGGRLHGRSDVVLNSLVGLSSDRRLAVQSLVLQEMQRTNDWQVIDLCIEVIARLPVDDPVIRSECATRVVESILQKRIDRGDVLRVLLSKLSQEEVKTLSDKFHQYLNSSVDPTDWQEERCLLSGCDAIIARLTELDRPDSVASLRLALRKAYPADEGLQHHQVLEPHSEPTGESFRFGDPSRTRGERVQKIVESVELPVVTAGSNAGDVRPLVPTIERILGEVAELAIDDIPPSVIREQLRLILTLADAPERELAIKLISEAFLKTTDFGEQFFLACIYSAVLSEGAKNETAQMQDEMLEHCLNSQDARRWNTCEVVGAIGIFTMIAQGNDFMIEKHSSRLQQAIELSHPDGRKLHDILNGFTEAESPSARFASTVALLQLAAIHHDAMWGNPPREQTAEQILPGNGGDSELTVEPESTGADNFQGIVPRKNAMLNSPWDHWACFSEILTEIFLKNASRMDSDNAVLLTVELLRSHQTTMSPPAEVGSFPMAFNELSKRFDANAEVTTMIDAIMTALEENPSLNAQDIPNRVLPRHSDNLPHWIDIRRSPQLFIETYDPEGAMEPPRDQTFLKANIVVSHLLLRFKPQLAKFVKPLAEATVIRLEKRCPDKYASHEEIRGLAVLLATLGPELDKDQSFSVTDRVGALIGGEIGSRNQTSLVLAIDGLKNNKDLTNADLINHLKWPHCVGFYRHVVLDALSERYKQKFSTGWDLARFLQEHDQALYRTLSQPARRPMVLRTDN